MIISASYKTDIPTFFGEWFTNRLRSGYCMVVNPYSRAAYRISLSRNDVDGFVFWSKNFGPFMDKLEIVHQEGYPFMVQYTINGYPRTLEFSVINAERSVSHMKVIADKYGPRVAVWRYDPIILTSVTPLDFHKRNFETLAKALEGTTDEVVVSFAQLYKKTLRNMNWATTKFEFEWEDPGDDIKMSLLRELAQIAHAHKMQLTICSQPHLLVAGTRNAHCVEAKRLSDIVGREVVAKLKGNRPGCGCFVSRDIGEYDTCPHGCVYCYAVQNRGLARTRHRLHDPSGEFLFQPSGRLPVLEFKNPAGEPAQGKQIKLL